MGWYQFYWVYCACSLAIDTSGSQLLLVSMIPTHLQARRCSVICRPIFSVWLRTYIVSLRNHLCLWRCGHHPLLLIGITGCVSITFCFQPFNNSLSSQDIGCSDRRWPAANVEVHSYLSSKSVKLHANFCILWICKASYSFSILLGGLSTTLLFHVSVACFFISGRLRTRWFQNNPPCTCERDGVVTRRITRKPLGSAKNS